MKKLLSILVFVFCFSQVIAQQQLLQERNYNQSNLEKQIYTSAVNQQGKILYSGSTLVNSHDYRSTFLLVNTNADTLWTRRGPIDLELYYQALQPTQDGGFIFAATAENPNIGASTGLLLQKLNANALPVWTQTNYYNNTSNAPSALLAMPDKGYLVAGYIKGKGYTLLRTDSLGNQKWLKDFAYNSWDGIEDMQFTKNGNIITAGVARVRSTSTWKQRLLLINQNGDSLKGAQLLVSGPNRREGMSSIWSSVTPLSDGGFLLTGYIDTVTSVFPSGMNLGTVVKVDANLNLKWKYVHRTINTDEYYFTKARELEDSTILVLGYRSRPVQGSNGFQLYHFTKKGLLLATYPFTSSICSQVWGVTLDYLASDSTYLIGGRCGNNPPITFGFYVAKVKLPGLSQPFPPVIISGIKDGLATGIGLGQSYPNPTTSEAIIPYSLPKNYREASIIIREIATGREIRKYELKRNESSLRVDLSSFSNGLYLYSLSVDDKPVATKKMAVMK